MRQEDIIHAWKDERFRFNLSAKQRDEVPADPSGEIELDDDNLTFAGATASPEEHVTPTVEATLAPCISAFCAPDERFSLYPCPPML